MSWKRIARPHLMHFEGLRLEAYDDGTGVLTIGYGHTGPDVRPGMKISKEEALRLLDEDMEEHAAAIDATVKVPINDRMKAALLGLVFNIGGDRWANDATALRRLNAKDYAGCAEAMTWWNKADMDGDGDLEPVEGLIRRREAERAMFMRGFAEMQGAKMAEAPMPTPRKVTGGEQKPMTRSKTMAGALGGLASLFPAVVQAFSAMDWKVAVPLVVVGGALSFLAFNRWLEARKGEH